MTDKSEKRYKKNYSRQSQTPNQKLIRFVMLRNNLSRQQLADLIGVSIHTIRSWLLPIRSPAHRQFPKDKQELLAYKINELVRKYRRDANAGKADLESMISRNSS